jgi:hypothetical protein
MGVLKTGNTIAGNGNVSNQNGVVCVASEDNNVYAFGLK